MSNFSDEQDRALVQLVLQNQSPIVHSIDWDAVTEQFPRASRVPKKTKLALRRRLDCLKRTYGRDVSRFPARLLGRSNAKRTPPPVTNDARIPARPPSPPDATTGTVLSFQQLLHPPLIPAIAYQVSTSTASASTVSSFTASFSSKVTNNQGIQTASTVDELGTLPTPSVRLVRRTKPVLESFIRAMSDQAALVVNTLNEKGIYRAIDRIFANITRLDVSQPHGTPSQNSGEILPTGVTKMIEAMNVMSTYVFGDIGSGTGSVLAQVALQTQVQRCIGLEIREVLADRSLATLRSFYEDFPRLSRVAIHSGDIKNLTPQARTEFETCTVLYCNNVVFAPQDNQAVQDFILTSRNVCMVLLTARFCGRCRGSRCLSPYCQEWEIEHRPLKVEASWRAAPVDVFVYHRRNTSVADSITDVLEQIPDEDDTDEDDTPFTSFIRII